MKRIAFVSDFALNLLASIVTTGVVQLILYPLLGRIYSAAEYGMILTVMGMGNTVVSSIGGSLNNVRLMVDVDYDEAKVQGDFALLLWVLSLTGAAVFAQYVLIAHSSSVLLLLFLFLYAIFGSLRGYGAVVFRIVINYKSNLICSCMVALGNLLGIVIIYVAGIQELWALPFLLGEVLGVILIARKTGIYKEPVQRTRLFADTVQKESILLLTTLFASLLTYLDRLLLLPILGGEAVSYYTVASFFGKSLGIVMTPMAGVLLSYYAQKGFVMTRRLFWKTNLLTLAIALCFMLACVVFGRWGTGLFYPELIEEAAPYLVLANAAAIVGIVGNMTQPAVLKFARTEWQIVIQMVYCVVYICGGIWGAELKGLNGFAYASLGAALIRLILLYGVANHTFSRRVV